MAKLTKSGGTTPTERHLAKLCEKTFLRLWSYPNLYRDQGGGKELCDLLIVSGDHIIIFSDKSCTFQNTGDIVRDWQRWFRRSVLESAKQIYGAERWIRNYPDLIFLDPKCENRLPIELPSSDSARFHRIIVARGAGKRCSEFFGGDTGSLMVRNDIVGSDHIDPNVGSRDIFTIGQVDPEKGFVHVLDDENLDILLNELDTVSDFVGYLTKKEELFASDKTVQATGEEDLLAYYLTHINSDGEHDFVFPSDFDLVVMDHCYAEMPKDDQYIEKKRADEVSYMWDRLIEHTSKHISEGTLSAGNEYDVSYHERGLRILASENRLARRGLANALGDLIFSTPMKKTKARVVVTEDKSGTGYCFLVCAKKSEQDYEEYREFRAGLLQCYCRVMKVKYPQLEHIVGIATESGHVKGRSEDLVYLDGTEWSDDDQAQAIELQKKLGILKSPEVFHVHDTEYPELDNKAPQPAPTRHLNRQQRRANRAKRNRKKK